MPSTSPAHSPSSSARPKLSAFDRQHDLDAWTHYLVGWLAQLRIEQGQLDEAERIAREVLATPRRAAVMRLCQR